MYPLTLALLLIAHCLPVLSAIQGYTHHTRQDGQSRLLGSSFGVPGVNATYDYIVVGGGTAGLTVAHRLAQNGSFSVAVVEAGGFYELDNGNISQIPAYDMMYSSGLLNDIQPTVDWGIVTTPQAALNGRQIAYTQGKTLGGSSARNYMAYVRSSAGAYQRWADMLDDPSFTFSNLLPYFKKSPEFTAPDYAKRKNDTPVTYDSAAFSPRGGPLQVSYVNYLYPTSPYVQQAFDAVGLKRISGLNSGESLGYSEATQTTDPQSGIRSSSETSFLQESIATTDLQIYYRTLVQKILFDDTKRVRGVAVETAGSRYVLSAKKEVILAAGAFRSPQLLMVSGIGPANALQGLGIEVLSDLPGVGQNLQDHPLFFATYRVNVTTNSELTTNPAAAAKATDDFLSNGSGPLNGGAPNNWVGFEKLPLPLRTTLSNSTLSTLSTYPLDWPELELPPIASALGPVNDTANYWSMDVAILTPTSRGNVTINLTSTDVNPNVNPNWLATIADQELAIAGFKRVRQITAETGMVIDEAVPGVGVESDEDILGYLKGALATFHHAAGTCAMGKSSDPNAVVDSRGKVFGVQSLRVVDSSTFPILPPGHPQATVYMLAEKLAEDILQKS